MAEQARLQIRTSTEVEAWTDIGHVTDTEKLPAVIYSNTVKDRTGTDLIPIVDADGHLQIDVLTGGGGTAYTEDVATPLAIVGTALMMERDDALATVTPIEGDWLSLRGTAEGALWTEDFNSEAIKTAVELIDNAISGSEMQVDVITMPSVAVTNGGLTELAAAINASSQMDVNIAASGVDVMLGTDFSAVLGTADLTILAQADNIVNTQDTIAVSAFGYLFDGATWDRAKGDSTDGALVNLGANNDVTVSATDLDIRNLVAATDIVTANLSATDNAVLDAIELDTTTIAGAVSGTEMQVDVLTMPTVAVTGTFWQATQPVSLASVPSHAVTNAGTFAVQDSQDVMLGTDFSAVLGTASLILATQADDVVNTSDGIQVTNFNMVFDGTTWDRLRGDSVNGALVNLGANNDVTVTSGSITEASGATIATNTGGAATSLAILDDLDNTASDGASVSGDVAHDGIDAGEPVKMGMKAVALKANPTEVAANDRTNWYADVSGIPFVLGGHPNIITQSLQITDADGAATDVAIITVAANVAIVVTGYEVTADNANTVDVSCRIGFGTANTPAADAAQVIMFHPGIAAGSGVVRGDGSGILGIGASNEDLRVTCEDPVTGSINIVISYFTTDI